MHLIDNRFKFKIDRVLFDVSSPNKYSNNYYIFTNSNEKQGWMNNDGKILKEGFVKCYPFKNGLGMFETEKTMGFINNYGKIIFESNYCSDFVNEVAVFSNENGFGWINTSGEILGENYSLCTDFEAGFGVFYKAGFYGCIDKKGKIILNYSPSLFTLKKINDKIVYYDGIYDGGFINKETSEIIIEGVVNFKILNNEIKIKSYNGKYLMDFNGNLSPKIKFTNWLKILFSKSKKS